MKRSGIWIGSVVASLLVASLYIACQKEATTTNNGSDNVVFSASIAGTSWKADSVSAYLQDNTLLSAKIMTITGYSSTKQITLILTDSSKGSSDSTIANKDYVISDSLISVIFTYAASPVAVGTDSIWSSDGAGQSGQATVTADDGKSKRVTGNFQFITAVITIDSTSARIDTLQITNGQFKNVSYQYIH